jgi:hypothetical protein
MIGPSYIQRKLDRFLVQVNYCHHLASVVCMHFTFQASSLKPLGQLEPNLAGMFLGWLALIILVVSEKKAFEHFPIGSNVNLCPWISDRHKNRNLVKDIPMIIHLQFGFSQFISSNCPGMIIGRSSTNFLFFMPIGNPRWLPPQYID